ncbi:MAG TPA: HAD hydrolase-like protein [Bryobacteraceae bacterium]|nr:HAD hydrolase-like protein [Bryobacteraceae bacterium]
MQPIRAILFDPVGCLAEFPADPFLEMAARLFARKKKPARSASRAYWHLLNLMEAADDLESIESLELEAATAATVYEDVIPALAELRSMNVNLLIATSLSHPAVARFLEKAGAARFFSAVWTRTNSGGIKTVPVAAALRTVDPRHAIYLTDTAEGLATAFTAGISPVLMMNDPDEAKRLAVKGPAGGIVSLHELPDFIRLVAARA